MNKQTRKWINVRLDERGLWTADLYDGASKIENLGGSYPKSQSTTIDAQNKWGRELTLRLNASPESLTFE